MVVYSQPAIYEQCSVEQQVRLADAARNAQILADKAVSSLHDPLKRGLYIKWFGLREPMRELYVTIGYEMIRYRFKEQVITYKCDCNLQGWYALVQKWNPFVVHICPDFFGAKQHGINSQGGILLHEMSHFSETVKTFDQEYGYAPTQWLALLNPRGAIANADNYEFYAEEAGRERSDPVQANKESAEP